MRQSGAIELATGHGPRDHTCWVHGGEQEWRATAVPYLSEGAKAGDQLLYVGAKSVDDLADDLADLPERDTLRSTGQLRIMSVSEAYGDLADFTAAGQIKAFHGEALAAATAGYRTLRLASEATTLVPTPEHARRFAAYELLVDAMVARSPLTALCGYDGNLISREAEAALCFVHPLRHSAGQVSPAGMYAEDGERWRLHGEIDLAVRALLELSLSTLPDDTDLHLDLGALEFIDAAGVRQLVVLAERLAPGRRLVLHETSSVVRRTLETAWSRLPDALEVAS